MSRIEADHFLLGHRVAKVKLMRPDDIAFRTDAKELALNRIEIETGIDRFRKNLIERIRQPFPR